LLVQGPAKFDRYYQASSLGLGWVNRAERTLACFAATARVETLLLDPSFSLSPPIFFLLEADSASTSAEDLLEAMADSGTVVKQPL
jgi:hypothetical protein